jgi:tRNA A37 threonylcarbamoyladenosine dehydratase
MLRKRLRKQGVPLDIPVVYSTEPAGAVLPPDELEDRYERGRIRNRLPSLPTLPAMFGNAAAQVVISGLSGLGPDR